LGEAPCWEVLPGESGPTLGVGPRPEIET